MDKVERLLRKYAVKERVEYGKANPKSVLGKVLGEYPELRPRAKDLVEVAHKVCEEVNNLEEFHVREEFQAYTYTKPQKEEKIWIENPTEGAVTRFPPEPSGYLHIGHAKAAFLNQKIAEDYHGHTLLRFDDTNPKNESWEYVEAIREDLEWLGFSPKKETFTSDYIERLYVVARKLIQKGYAYITTAPAEIIKASRKEGRAIPGREKSIEEHLELFENMLEGAFGEGEAALLFKGDPQDPNTAMRDPTLMRIIEAEHYRVGDRYRVWPTYDLAVPFVDSWEGVTHAIRSKEYELRKALYHTLLDILEERKPTLMHFSRLNIRGVPLSKRVLRQAVSEGIVSGWDDPRMPTIRGLKRRGIHPEAIKRFALRFGIGKQEKEVGWDLLEKENRRVLDSFAKRLMAVENGIEVKLDRPIRVEAPFHPNKPMGFRKLSASAILVEREDWKFIQDGALITLRYAGTFKKEGNTLYNVGKISSNKVLHWVPADKALPITVYFPNPLIDREGNFIRERGEERSLLVEPAEDLIDVGELVQFERKFFARKDKEKYYIYSS